MLKLKFGQGNAKLSETIATFSLPAGFTCPCAKDCLSKSNRETGMITDGKDTEFRCFAATGEARATVVRKARWYNFDLLRQAKTISGMRNLIISSLPEIQKVRVHVSGDFFNEIYFNAWLETAIQIPNVIFYGYTKRCGLLVSYRKQIPPNFRFTASLGGTEDYLIFKHKLKFAKVVYSMEQAEQEGLEIDHDDSHAIEGKKSFALLLHGTQPKGSIAGEAWKVIKKTVGGYNRRKDSIRDKVVA